MAIYEELGIQRNILTWLLAYHRVDCIVKKSVLQGNVQKRETTSSVTSQADQQPERPSIDGLLQNLLLP